MAIRDNDLYVFTHPETRGAVEERFRRILAAYDKPSNGLRNAEAGKFRRSRSAPDVAYGSTSTMATVFAFDPLSGGSLRTPNKIWRRR